MRRLRNHARSEAGFTLPEVVTSVLIAMVVSLAAFALIDFTIRRTGDVAGRVEATQKGRAAMDIVTQHLRSQVCLTSTTPPLEVAGANVAMFYADLSDGEEGLAPERHTMTYDPVQRTLIETDFVGTRAGSNITYPAQPTRARLLVENAVPDTPGAPIFRYYAFDTQDPPRPSLELLPTVALPDGTTTLSAADRARTVRVEIAFRALPPNETDPLARPSILLHDDVYVRAADPDDPRDVRTLDPDDPLRIPPVCS